MVFFLALTLYDRKKRHKHLLEDCQCSSVELHHLHLVVGLQESNLFANALTELKGKPVLVLGHRRPDGDCIGSQVGLTRVLIELGVNARAINQDPVPRTLKKLTLL